MSDDPCLACADSDFQTAVSCDRKIIPVGIENPIANQTGQIIRKVLCGVNPVKIFALKNPYENAIKSLSFECGCQASAVLVKAFYHTDKLYFRLNQAKSCVFHRHIIADKIVYDYTDIAWKTQRWWTPMLSVELSYFPHRCFFRISRYSSSVTSSSCEVFRSST